MYGNVVDSSSDNIPTSFSTAAGSRLSTGVPSSGQLFFLNYTAHVLAYTIDNGQNAPGSTLPGNQGFIPAAPSGGAGVASFSPLKISKGDKIYVRAADGSLANSGKLFWFVI